MPSIGLDGHVPNVWRMGPERWQARDVMDEVLSRILPPPPRRMIRLQHVFVVGRHGSGKSELVKWLALNAWQRYGGADGVNIL